MGRRSGKVEDSGTDLCHSFFLIFITLSPQLEDNNTFPCAVTNILCMKTVGTAFLCIVVFQSLGECPRINTNFMVLGSMSATYVLKIFNEGK